MFFPQISRFSVKFCNHSGTSCDWWSVSILSESAPLWSPKVVTSLRVVPGCVSFRFPKTVGSFWIFGFVLLRFPGTMGSILISCDSGDFYPALSMLKTNCLRKWMTDSVQQEVRNCRSCKWLSSYLWSIVAFGCWHTHLNIGGLNKAYQAIELLAFPPVISPSRINQTREHILVLPRLLGLPHFQSPPWWGSWIASTYPFLLTSNLSCSACA